MYIKDANSEGGTEELCSLPNQNAIHLEHVLQANEGKEGKVLMRNTHFSKSRQIIFHRFEVSLTLAAL